MLSAELHAFLLQDFTLIDVVFVAIGRGVVESNEELSNPIDKFGLGRQFLLLGERNDIDNVMGSLDLLISTSAWGEGFPNVLGEAMAAGVPCVTTDVGESATIVGDSGVVVEVGKPMVAGCVGEVVISKNNTFHVGDIVTGMLDWADYSVVSARKELRLVDSKSAPLPYTLELVSQSSGN